jgi:hypothetical protein
MAEFTIECPLDLLFVGTGVSDEGEPASKYSLYKCPSCGESHEWSPSQAKRLVTKGAAPISVPMNSQSMLSTALRRRIINSAVAALGTDEDAAFTLRLHGVANRLDFSNPDWSNVRLVLGSLSDSSLLDLVRDIGQSDPNTAELLKRASDEIGSFPESTQMGAIKSEARTAIKLLRTAQGELEDLVRKLNGLVDKNGDPDGISFELWGVERLALPALNDAMRALERITEATTLRDLMEAVATLNANRGVVQKVLGAVTNPEVHTALQTILTALHISALVA